MSIEMALINYNRGKYKEYINEHRLNVQKAWDNMKNNSECIKLIKEYLSDDFIKIIDPIILNHDLSKYSKEEFEPYRKQFYPINNQEKKQNKNEFNMAWKHHYMNNPHHWDYWYNINSDMPFLYIVEMICDWEAMGYKFGNTSFEWYNKNKENIHLGDRQRVFAEKLMETINK